MLTNEQKQAIDKIIEEQIFRVKNCVKCNGCPLGGRLYCTKEMRDYYLSRFEKESVK